MPRFHRNYSAARFNNGIPGDNGTGGGKLPHHLWQIITNQLLLLLYNSILTKALVGIKLYLTCCQTDERREAYLFRSSKQRVTEEALFQATLILEKPITGIYRRSGYRFPITEGIGCANGQRTHHLYCRLSRNAAHHQRLCRQPPSSYRFRCDLFRK